MVLHNLQSYQGKCFDTFTSSIQIILSGLNFKTSAYIDCLCARPFAFQFNIKNSSIWFSPLIKPIEGLYKLSDLLHNYLKINIYQYNKNNDIQVFFSQIDELLLSGDVIIGPLDKSKIWNRIDSLYFKGAEYFIVVTGKEDNKYVINDPIGCPYITFPKELICNSMFDNFITIQFEAINLNCNYNQLNNKALLNGIKYRMDNIYNDLLLQNGISEFLKTDVIKLKSSQEASLQFGIPNYSIFLLQLEFLIQDIISDNCNSQFKKENLNDILLFIRKYRLFLSDFLFSIQKRNDNLLIHFQNLLMHELEINKLLFSFFKLYEQTNTDIFNT